MGNYRQVGRRDDQKALRLPRHSPGVRAAGFLRHMVRCAAGTGMSDPGLHDRAAGGRLAGPARAISLVLTPGI
jgi:hypothetical protein